MTLPVGTISMSQVNTELAIPATTTISLNQTNVRSLAGVPTGTISMNNLRGKSASFSYTTPISAPVQNYNLRTAMIAAGYPGTGAFNATFSIAPGVYVWSDSTSIAAFDTGALSGGSITVTNAGFIMGKGGMGGARGAVGLVGGVAINLQHPMTLTNNSNIGGGGGGGGGDATGPTGGSGGGGGQGGGQGGTGNPGVVGGAGGAIGASGANSAGVGGGGGGRVFPGVGATNPYSIGGGGVVLAPGKGGTGGGSGGVGYGKPPSVPAVGTGGAGGAAGVAGGQASIYGGGGGGGFGASGAAGKPSPGAVPNTVFPGGVSGKAINLNGNALTRPAIGNTYGAVS